MTNPIDKAALRALAEAATPGPWISAGPSFGAPLPAYLNEVVVDRPGDDDHSETIAMAEHGTEEESTANIDFIAAANPTTIIALLDELATQAAKIEACRAEAARPDQAEDALLKVLAEVQRYLPPDGPTAHEAMSNIIAIVDPWPLAFMKEKTP